MKNLAVCPCESGEKYADCCQPFIEKTATPQTAVQLMRSRYTAFTLGDLDYLLHTWSVETRPRQLQLDKNIKWIGLKILQEKALSDNAHTVKFVARYKLNGKAFRLVENSYFLRTAGQWIYVKGIDE